MNVALHVNSLIWVHCNQKRDIWADFFFKFPKKKFEENRQWKPRCYIWTDRVGGSSASYRTGVIQ